MEAIRAKGEQCAKRKRELEGELMPHKLEEVPDTEGGMCTHFQPSFK